MTRAVAVAVVALVVLLILALAQPVRDRAEDIWTPRTVAPAAPTDVP